MSDLLLTIPAHSVECERGFSLMKKVKTDWWKKLNTNTQTGLTRIVLQTPDCKQFDLTPAILYWEGIDERKQCHFQPPYGPIAATQTTADGMLRREGPHLKKNCSLVTTWVKLVMLELILKNSQNKHNFMQKEAF